MTSDEARDLFGEALEGSLSPAQRSALDAALASDAELREEFEAFEQMMQGMSRLSAARHEPAPDLLPGVQSKIRRRTGGRYFRDRFASETRGRGAVLPTLVVIALLLVLVAAWLTFDALVLIAPGS